MLSLLKNNIFYINFVSYEVTYNIIVKKFNFRFFLIGFIKIKKILVKQIEIYNVMIIFSC